MIRPIEQRPTVIVRHEEWYGMPIPSIIRIFKKEAKRQGWSREEIAEVLREKNLYDAILKHVAER